jgi:hypothetical protein
MVALPRLKMDFSAFEAFVNAPENANKRFERLMGEALEMPSSIFASF